MSATADDRAAQAALSIQNLRKSKTDIEVNHKTDEIRKLNDQFRETLIGGTFLITPGIQAMSAEDRTVALIKLTGFKDFTPDNDPHGEHDFGAFKVGSEKLFWKIEYYALDMLNCSDNPSDPTITKRVLTLMLSSEY